ncbi:GigA [Oceaniovalibus guishaninsula JLT2003]|uniref:Glycogen synthase n=1 Tax=Oceaniovalibus guishaninsula JLT2003 TaxID=1231392 RepID=K2I7Q5_9RHOB|nr:glycogen synthase GlgA [Oceaniovalibus guishaninsula]EKE45045.1 GigA [Oceaniovalibus guishaninsula JLT2003]
MRVLSVASECAPLVKTGGLADVVGALPAALADFGVDMRVMLPGYRPVMHLLNDAHVIWQDPALFGGAARVLEGRAGGLDVLIVDAPHLFDRPGGPYLDEDWRDWPDNIDRFAALCRAAEAIAAGQWHDWQPEIVHCHDWQAGLLPYFLKQSHVPVPSVLTVHNIAFNGSTAADAVRRLGLDAADFHPDGYEFWGQVSTLKAGLVWADAITTVSPTYAKELTTPQFGLGLEGVIRAREGDLTGILNGIDTETWDPSRDAHVVQFDTAEGKRRATRALKEELGLPPGEGPLAVVVSRLSAQKGLDLLLEALPGFLDRGGMLALLGSGEPALEQGWRDAARQHPGVAVRIGYDEALAHRMMAGGEAVLVPSRFEPCGLTQLYGLRYGAVPVVARTGGLADTVIHANAAALATGVATGIVHDPGSVAALSGALETLADLYADRDGWTSIIRRAMSHPVGWDGSAERYAALYRSLSSSRTE